MMQLFWKSAKGVLSRGLKVTHLPFIRFVTYDIKIIWHSTTKSTKIDVLERLILRIEDKRICLGENFFGSWQSSLLVFKVFKLVG